MKITPLTMRSKIAVKWSTAPGDVGYEGRKTDWETATGELMGMRAAYNFPATLDRHIGQSVFRAIRYYHCGVQITRDQIEAVIFNAEAEGK